MWGMRTEKNMGVRAEKNIRCDEHEVRVEMNMGSMRDKKNMGDEN